MAQNAINNTIVNANFTVPNGTITAGTGLTVTAGGATISGNSTINGGTVGIGTDNAANAITIGTGTTARLINLGRSAAAHVLLIGVNNGVSSTSIEAGTGNLTINSGGTALIDSSGVLELNSSAGALSIGNDAVAQAINIGTGTAARTITVGNTTGATDLDLRCGTGDFTLASATGTIINAADTGEINYPLQPAFSAFLPSDDTNVTGAGATFTLGAVTALTEIFDQNGDFNTNGTFTAPVTGRYFLYTCYRILNAAAGMTQGTVIINTSNRLYATSLNVLAITGAPNNFSAMQISCVADMDAGDTATSQISILGGAGDTADIDGDAAPRSFFCGYLVA